MNKNIIKNILFILIFVMLFIKVYKLRLFNNDYYNNVCKVILITLLVNVSNYCIDIPYPEKKGKISIIMLNFNRPHNLKKSLMILNTYSIIDEIIISHGKPSTYEEFDFPKVRNIKDFELDKLYGSALRFLRVLNAKNDIVLFIDDDTLPSENTVVNTYNMLMKNYHRNTIYGHMARVCDGKGYHHTSRNHNVILTPYLMCKRKIILDYLKDDKIGFNKFKKFFKKHKGNCEDLSLNYFVEKEYFEKPVLVSGKGITQLDIHNGFSSNGSEHKKLRSGFCKHLNFLDS